MKFGAIGTGAITVSMLTQFQASPYFSCEAILSRKEETGRAMADRFGIPKVYTLLEDMLSDPEIELIYVASPNSIHYGQAKAALLAGKHVICEKPFTPTVAQTRELIALAKEKGLFLFEAITTAHHPNYARIREGLALLGPIKTVIATFCQFSSRYPALLAGKPSPVLDPAYCGGALMDINLYNIHFVVGLFGAPERVHYYPNLHSTGIDTSGLLVLEYPGFVCQCVGAKDCAANNSTQVVGENGYLSVTPGSSNCQTLELCLRGQETQKWSCEPNPWYYEVNDIGRMIAEGDLAGCHAALDTTLAVVSVLEAARKDGDLNF